VGVGTQKAMTKSLVAKERGRLLASLEEDAAALLHSQMLEGAD
jgi:hypothetical protein